VLGLLFRKFRQQIRAGVPKIPANKTNVRDAYFAKMAVPRPRAAARLLRGPYVYMWLSVMSVHMVYLYLYALLLYVFYRWQLRAASEL